MKRRILSITLAALLVLTVFPFNFAFAAMMGDVDGNGAVTAADARLALRASVSLEKLTEEQIKVADTDGNPGVTAADARLILRASVGLENLHTHEYIAAITTKPTCTEKGVKTFTCSCGDSYTEEVAATGHTEVKDAAIAPTCTATGKTEGSHCSVCKAVIKAQGVVAAKGHTETVVKGTAATCSKSGKTDGIVCSVCKTTIKAQQNIPATGNHTGKLDKATVIAVTCQKDGYTGDTKCTVCGAITKKGSVIKSTGEEHNISNVTVSASCTQDGYTVDKCTECDYFISESVKETGEKASGHTWSKPQVIKPTCTEQGYTLEVCTACESDRRTNYTDASGHTYSWKTNKKASCKETGLKTGTCTVCSDVTTEVIGLQPCTPASTSTKIRGSKTDNISCTEAIKCTVCSKNITVAESDNAHTVTQSNSTAASCTTDGEKDLACRYCNYTKHVVYEKALGHTNDKAIRVEATCTKDGYVEFSGKCTRCLETFEATRITLKAKGHTETGIQTCTTSVTCTVCRETLHDKLGHDYGVTAAAYNTEINTFFCKRCGTPTSDQLGTFNNVVNKIVTYEFYNNFCGTDSTDGTSEKNRLFYIDKTAVKTTYSRFDFGIYTSAIKSLYEDEMANTPDTYTAVRNGYITSLKLQNQAVSLLTASDIDSITVERLPSVSISDVLSGFSTTYTVGNKSYDLTKYKNVKIDESVIKVTIDVKNEKYSTIKDLPDDQLTSIQKITNVNLRDEITGYEKNAAGELVMTEQEKGDGYEISMTMKLRELSSDARVVYYFRESTYEPIIALYYTDLTMDQTIDMKFKLGLTINGELDPIITTNYTRAYLFPNFFDKY